MISQSVVDQHIITLSLVLGTEAQKLTFLVFLFLGLSNSNKSPTKPMCILQLRYPTLQ